MSGRISAQSAHFGSLSAGRISGTVNIVSEDRVNIQPGIELPVVELTATGAAGKVAALMLNHASTIIAATIDAPSTGHLLFISNTSASGTAAHTVTTPAGTTFDGTNNTATLNAPGEALVVIGVSSTAYRVLLNVGSVGLSSV